MAKKENLQIGYDFCTVSNIITAISSVSEVGYNKYYVPIAHPRYKREFSDEVVMKSNGDDFSRSLVAVYPQGTKYLYVLHSLQYTKYSFFQIDRINYIIGKLSDYVNADSEDIKFRQFSETTIDQEIRWCVYLGMSAVLVSLPVENSFVNLARIIYAKLRQNYSSPMVGLLLICKEKNSKLDHL